jgi:hypothetical protein
MVFFFAEYHPKQLEILVALNRRVGSAFVGFKKKNEA